MNLNGVSSPPALCERVGPLVGHRIGVTADRRAEEQGELLTRLGARVQHGAVIRTLPLDEDVAMRIASDALINDPPTCTLLTTGIGVRAWFAAAETWGFATPLLAALASGVTYARGPKAHAAATQIGLRIDHREPTERLDAMVDNLVRDPRVRGAHVAIQLYGQRVPWAVSALEGAGARVTVVPVYRWVEPADDGPARRLVHAAAERHLSAVTFTCPAAVERTEQLAIEEGIADELRAAFATAVAAVCVGPVTGAAAARAGYVACAPEVGRLGLMVRALVARLDGDHRHLRTPMGHVVLQGAVVHDGHTEVELGGHERAVLAELARVPGSVQPKARLALELWGSADEVAALEATVARLRRKLERVGMHVISRPRRGYQLDATYAPCERRRVNSPSAPAP